MRYWRVCQSEIRLWGCSGEFVEEGFVCGVFFECGDEVFGVLSDGEGIEVSSEGVDFFDGVFVEESIFLSGSGFSNINCGEYSSVGQRSFEV